MNKVPGLLMISFCSNGYVSEKKPVIVHKARMAKLETTCTNSCSLPERNQPKAY